RRRQAAKRSAPASACACCRAVASRASRTNRHPQHAAQAAVERMCEAAHAFFFVRALSSTHASASRSMIHADEKNPAT
ncbi:hypothetical protein, partial [Burkholderia cenocepacia]|uniref:hypothetical protein n=1 Tax=Burkholderia cenocepacia TaxID=95486 RepID=UPI002AB626EC